MCPLAHGATATWNQVGEAEHLTLRFDFRLLDTTPRKKIHLAASCALERLAARAQTKVS